MNDFLPETDEEREARIDALIEAGESAHIDKGERDALAYDIECGVGVE